MIKPFQGGNELARRHLNELVSGANSVGTIVGDEMILVAKTANGVAIRLAIDSLIARLPKFNIQWARAIVPDARSDDCAWIRPGAEMPYVYGWPSNADGDGTGEPALSSATEDQFVKIMLPTGPRTGTNDTPFKEPNIRGGDVIPYYISEAQFWIGPWPYDQPISTVKMWQILGADVSPPGGWVLMNDTVATGRFLPSVDVDDDPDIWDVAFGIARAINTEQRLPMGSDTNPTIAGAGLVQGAIASIHVLTAASAPSTEELGIWGTHFIARYN